MGRVSIQSVTKQFGGQIVLENVTLELHTGETVGLIGPNGSGKTTLFRLITGELQTDTGTVTRSRGLEIGYLPQEPSIALDRTLHDEVIAAFAELFELEARMHELSDRMAAEHEGPDLNRLMAEYDDVNARFITAGGYAFEQRVNEILGGLGFVSSDHKLPMAVLSGGQKCRAALGKLLLQDASLLLLDEPTNHLDIDAVRWLEKFLAGHHGGAVIVSHDRYLLDRLADRIVEIEARRLVTYPGNYTNYAKVKKVRRLTQQRQYQKDKEFIGKERDFIARHLAGQRTKEAQGRRKRLERGLAAGEFTLEVASTTRQAKFRFSDPPPKGSVALRAEGLAKRYGDKVLFDGLGFQVESGQRLGITGPNGTGKSTLLKILLGEVAPDAGRFEFDRKATLGYYAQDPEELDPETLLLEHLRAERPHFSELEARSCLARFLFTGDDVFKRLGRLSGGEQSRVRLLKLMLDAPNMLLLDEPTNHLDIRSREALEEALTEYPGTIIVASHDRYFLDRIVTHLLVLRDGRHDLYFGNYSRYIEQLEQRQASVAAGDKPRSKKTKRADKPATRAKGKTVEPPERKRFLKLGTADLESVIFSMEEQVGELEARFGDPEIYKNGESVGRLRTELDQLRHELSVAEQVWSERADDS